MSTAVIDHRLVSSTLDIATASRVVMKICELCRGMFVCDKDEAVSPGDYIELQRKAGHRRPLICKHCEANPVDFAFMQEEAAEMQRVAQEIRETRNRRIERELKEVRVQARAMRPVPEMSKSEREGTQRRARQHYASWRQPLLDAFKTRGSLTMCEIRLITKINHSITYFRRLLPEIYVSEPHHGLGRGRGFSEARYSFGKERAVVTPPQDSVTHKFMKEVKPEPEAISLREMLRKTEADAITQMLLACSGNKAKAARKLGLNYVTLLAKIKRMNQGDENPAVPTPESPEAANPVASSPEVVGEMPQPTETQEAAIEFTDEFIEAKLAEYRKEFTDTVH